MVGVHSLNPKPIICSLLRPRIENNMFNVSLGLHYKKKAKNPEDSTVIE